MGRTFRSRTATLLFAAAVGVLMIATSLSAAADTFSYTGSIQTFVLPSSGNYTLLGSGAQGGNAGSDGGLGATVGGSTFLSAGTILDIVVGGAGSSGLFGFDFAGGGGGGTFVWIDGSTTPLLVAGGGGGSSRYTFRDGGAGQTSENGQDGFGSSGAGGKNGNGGGGGGSFGADGNYNGGGGAGWFSNGSDGGFVSCSNAAGGGGLSQSTFAGGQGAGHSSQCANGGFGGGGGGGYEGGGGGGGYSGGGGGGGGSGSDNGGGGGGGSYLAAVLANTTLTEGANSGDGSFSIDLESTPPAVPEPASLLLLSSGLAGLGVFKRKK